MAAIINKNQIFLVSKTFGTKKSFKNFFDERVSACVRSMFSLVVGIRLCSVKFRHACLSALPQDPLCLHAMLRVVLASIGFPQSHSNVLCAFIYTWSNSFVFSRNDALFLSIGFLSQKRRKVKCFQILKSCEEAYETYLTQARKL